MRALANYKLALLLCWLALLPFRPAVADDEQRYGAEIASAEAQVWDGGYVLSADLDYRLSPKAMEALHSGVPLLWTICVKLKVADGWLWDKSVVEIGIRYRLQYHALLNMYRVGNESDATTRNFSTLPAALAAMSTLRNLRLVNKDVVQPAQRARIELKVHFDKDRLPLPLRLSAYLNRQWYLSSDWTTWPLKK